MRLRQRFSLSFAIILAIVVGTAGGASWQVFLADAETRSLDEAIIPQLTLTSRLSRQAWNARLASRSFALTGVAAYQSDLYQRLDELSATIAEGRTLARAHPELGALPAMLDACSRAIAEYHTLIDATSLAQHELDRCRSEATASSDILAEDLSAIETGIPRVAAPSAGPEAAGDADRGARAIVELVRSAARTARGSRDAVALTEIQRDDGPIGDAIGRMSACEHALREASPAAPETATWLARLADEVERCHQAMGSIQTAWQGLRAVGVRRAAAGEALIADIERVSGLGMTSIVQTTDRQGKLFRSVGAILVAGMAAVFLAGCGLILLLNRQVLADVAKLAQAAEDMAGQGMDPGAGAESSAWRSTAYGGGNEFGRIGRSLIRTVEQLAIMRHAIDASNHGIVITDATRLDRPIIYVNPHFERLSGYAAAEAVGRSGLFLLGDDQEQPGVDSLRQAIAIGREHMLVVKTFRKDGTAFLSEITTAPVRDAQGRLTHCVDIVVDVTTQLGAQTALADSENRYRTLVELSPLGIVIQQDGLVIFCNQAMAGILGFANGQELIGRTLLDLIHPDYHPTARERLRMLAEHRQSVGPVDEQFLRRDGSALDVEVSASPFTNAGRDAALVVVRDISQRKSAERQLSVAFAENELLVSTISSALIGLGTDERITHWNAAAERTFGLPAARVVGKPLGESGIDWDWGDFYVAMNRCLTLGKPVDLHDMRFRREQGSDGFLDVNIASSWAATGDGSENLGVIIMAVDTTERKIAESQRHQGLKLESIGQLAAGIAHEINTPIQFIGDNLRFLGDSFGDLARLHEVDRRLIAAASAGGEPVARVAEEAGALAKAIDLDYLSEEIPKAISQSLEGVDRVAVIVRAMKEFSHPDQAGLKPTDLNKALLTTITVARNEYKYVADLVTRFDERLPPVPCIVGEMNQVFLNMIVNAAHAIGDVVKNQGKGAITVTTRHDGDFAEVAFADTGTGIPEAVRDKIFDPFFTTKGVGKGTGQGLYLSHAIVVKKHGGAIRFETEVGRGTTFIIRLPLIARAS